MPVTRTQADGALAAGPQVQQWQLWHLHTAAAQHTDPTRRGPHGAGRHQVSNSLPGYMASCQGVDIIVKVVNQFIQGLGRFSGLSIWDGLELSAQIVPAVGCFWG